MKTILELVGCAVIGMVFALGFFFSATTPDGCLAAEVYHYIIK